MECGADEERPGMLQESEHKGNQGVDIMTGCVCGSIEKVACGWFC